MHTHVLLDLGLFVDTLTFYQESTTAPAYEEKGERKEIVKKLQK